MSWSTPTARSWSRTIAPNRVSLQEIARIANLRSDRLPEELDAGLEATRRYRAPDPGTFSNSLHAAIVEVNVRTGAVAILRYVVIEDCGTLVNPLIVDGQIIGGVAQGIGQALLEEAHYDCGWPADRGHACRLSRTYRERHSPHRNTSSRNAVSSHFGRI